MKEHARAYGFFDGLYGRGCELPEDPTERKPYMEGYHIGLAERKRMNAQDAPGATISGSGVEGDGGEGDRAAPLTVTRLNVGWTVHPADREWRRDDPTFHCRTLAYEYIAQHGHPASVNGRHA